MTEVLDGHDPQECIVGILPLDEGTVRIFRRVQGSVVHEDARCYPFFHLSEPSLLAGFTPKHWLARLEGNAFFSHLCVTEEWPSHWEALRHVLHRYNRAAGTKADSLARLPVVHVAGDPVVQYLLQSGKTLFKGMSPGDPRRLQLDIETYTTPPHRFSNPQRPGDRIILIALSDDTGWDEVVDGRSLKEQAMLVRLMELIRQRDPDIIEGHNILGFDLPYLQARCALHGLTLDLGRTGGGRTIVEPRLGSAERITEWTDIPGRHVVDTLLLVQSYDMVRRSMESHSLKDAARHFGLSSRDRVLIPGEKIAWHWDHDPDPLIRYALQDVEETRRLSERLSGSSFFLSRMLPLPLGTVARSGAAAKIESLLLRAYLREKRSVPAPSPAAQTTGGYTDIFLTGIVGPVVHVDVESLYPSLMLTRGIAPSSDTLGVFPSLLRELTTLRLGAKRRMQEAESPGERLRLDAMQSSFKILINSFYGYLGYSRGLFNDPAKADEVTRAGQETLRTMIEAIVSRGGTVVEVDTDGVFFLPPAEARGEDAEESFVQAVGGTLPRGITMVSDGRYAKMLSYKKKNYALLGYDGSLLLRGSSLTSRSMERFGRAFLRACIEHLLRGDIAALHREYVGMEERIRTHGLHVREFARTETLRDPLHEYEEATKAGTRNRSAAYEVALTRALPVRPGDRISFYVTGTDPTPRSFESCRAAEEWDPNFPDENTAYYLRRLRELTEKFSPLFQPKDFRAVFSAEDLFPFNPEGIELLTTPVRGTAIEGEEEAEEGEP